MKETCTDHNCKRKYCEMCLLSLNAEQSVLIDQLYKRLEAVSTVSEEMDQALIAAERKHPVAGIIVLSTVPFTQDMFTYFNRGRQGPARSELREVLENLINEFTVWRAAVPDALIGANSKGFFIYRFAT